MTMDVNIENEKTHLKGQAYFHEVGHAVDDFIDGFGNASNDNSYDFYEALQEDFEKCLKDVIKSNNCNKQEAYDSIIESVCSDIYYLGLQDILCGLAVKNDLKVEGRGIYYNHVTRNEDESEDYSYYTKKHIEREAFGHFFEAGMDYNTKNLQEIKKYFPTAYEMYHKMLSDDIRR